MTNVSIIAVVDDDESVRESLQCLLRSVGYNIGVFVSAEEFLKAAHFDQTDCLILDVSMPGMSGLDLQRSLKSRSIAIPIIFITGDSDQERKVQAMDTGAVAFLIKPLSEETVLAALMQALASKSS